MSKTFFLIPGYGESEKTAPYPQLKEMLEGYGFDVHIVPIPWDPGVMSDYVDEFKAFFQEHKGTKNYVLGFSFGAMIAFISAPEIQPDMLILCSMSPFFVENLESTPKHIREFWEEKGKMDDFQNFSYKWIVQRWKGPTVFFFGTKETAFLRASVDVIHKKSKKSWIYPIEEADHNIAHPAYIQFLEEFLKPLESD